MAERSYGEIIRTDLAPEFGERHWRPIQSFIDLAQNHLDALQISNEQKYLKILGIDEQYKPDAPLQLKTSFLMERLQFYSSDSTITQNAYEQLQVVLKDSGRECPSLERIQAQLEQLPIRPPVKVKVTNGQRTRLVSYDDVSTLDDTWQVVGFRLYDPGNGYVKDLMGYMGVTMKKNHPRTRGGIGEGLKVSANRLVNLGVKTTFVSAHQGELWQAEAIHNEGRLSFGLVRKWKRQHPERTGSFTDVDFQEALSQGISSSHVAKDTLTQMLDALDPRRGDGLKPYFIEFSDQNFIPIPRTIDFSDVSDEQLLSYINSADNKFAIPKDPEADRRIFARGVFITSKGDVLFDYDLPKWSIHGADRKTIRPEILQHAIAAMLKDTTDPQVIQIISQAMKKMDLTQEIELINEDLAKSLSEQQQDLWKNAIMSTFEFEVGKNIFAGGSSTSAEDLQLATQSGYKIIHIPSTVIGFLDQLYPEQIITIEQLKKHGGSRKTELPTGVVLREEVDTKAALVIRDLQQRIALGLIAPNSPRALDAHSQRLFTLPTMQIIGDTLMDRGNDTHLQVYFDPRENALVVTKGTKVTAKDVRLEIDVAVAMVSALIGENVYSTETQRIITELLGAAVNKVDPEAAKINIPEITTDDSSLFSFNFSSRKDAEVARQLIVTGQAIAKSQRLDATIIDVRTALTLITHLQKSGILNRRESNRKIELMRNDRPNIGGSREYNEIVALMDPYYYFDRQVDAIMNDGTLQNLPSIGDSIDRPDYSFDLGAIDPQFREKIKTAAEMKRLVDLWQRYFTIRNHSGTIDPKIYEQFNLPADGDPLAKIETILQLITKSDDVLLKAYLARFAYNDPERKKTLDLSANSRSILGPPLIGKSPNVHQITMETSELFQGLDLDIMPDRTVTMKFIPEGNPDHPILLTIQQIGSTVLATHAVPGEHTQIITRGSETNLGIGDLKVGVYGTVVRIVGNANYTLQVTGGFGDPKEPKPELHEGDSTLDCKIDVTYRNQIWDNPLRNILDEYSNRKDADPSREPQIYFSVFNQNTGELKREISVRELTVLDDSWKIFQFRFPDEGPGFSTEYLTGLGDSTKSEGNIGKHGEGMKLIMNAAVRAGIHVKVESNNWEAVPTRHTIQLPNTDTGQVESFDILRYQMHWKDHKRTGSQATYSLLKPENLKLSNDATHLTPQQLLSLNLALSPKAEKSPTNNWRSWTEIIDPRSLDANGIGGIERYIFRGQETSVVTLIKDRPGAIFEKSVYIPKETDVDNYIFGYEINASIVNTRERNDYEQARVDAYLKEYFRNLRDVSVMRDILMIAREDPNHFYNEYGILNTLAGLDTLDYQTRGLWAQAFYDVFGQDAVLSLDVLKHKPQRTMNSGSSGFASGYRSFNMADANTSALIPQAAREHVDLEYFHELKSIGFFHEREILSGSVQAGIDAERHLAKANLIKLPYEVTRFMHELGLIYSSENFAEDVNAVDLEIPPTDRQQIVILIQQVARTVGTITEKAMEDPSLRNLFLKQTTEAELAENLKALRDGIAPENIHIHSRKWPNLGGASVTSHHLVMGLNAVLLAEQREHLAATIAHELCHLLFKARDYTAIFQQVMMALAIQGERMTEGNLFR